MADAPTSDTDVLLARAAAGDAEAVELVFARYRGRLRAMVAHRMDRRLTPRVDPSDVVQECLATAHLKLADYLAERPVQFYPWLRSIAWDRLVDLHRRHVIAQRRSVDREVQLGPALSDASVHWLTQQLVASGTGPLQRMAEREMRQRVRQAMTMLTPSLAEALLLRYLEQLTAAEAADVLGISQVAYKQRLVRALRSLRELLLIDDKGER